MQSILVLDNGASTIKAGLTTAEDTEPRIIPNAVVRSNGDKATYIGHEIERCQDFASIKYRLPFEKGFVVDWDAQKAVWDGLFSSQVFNVDPHDTSLMITEPYMNLPNIQEIYDQFVFEEYGFQSYYRSAAAASMPYSAMFDEPNEPNLPRPECMLIVDSGFSYTHIVPILQGSIVWDAVLRIDVGGKILTNHLKELVSFRQWNMMDETFVMNEVKEACCYVTPDLKADLEACRVNTSSKSIVQEYILPDFSSRQMGRIRRIGEDLGEHDQIMHMGNERFIVPEVLFRPDDIGLAQLGIPEAILKSIKTLPDDIRDMFWSNVGVIGGNCRLPGFTQRLAAELQSLAPAEADVRVYIPSDPLTEAYKASLAFARSPAFASVAVTREEYQEHGKNIFCRRKFRGWNALSTDAVPQVVDRPVTQAESSSSSDEGPKSSRRGRAVAGRRGAGRRGRGRGRA